MSTVVVGFSAINFTASKPAKYEESLIKMWRTSTVYYNVQILCSA